MNENVHFDIPFDEDGVFDVDVGVTTIINDAEVMYGSTEFWNSQPQLLSIKSTIYIYSDYQTTDDKNVAGIKVGDGITLLKDLPFTDEYVLSILADKADKSEIPTNVSELTNDSDYQTGEQLSIAIFTAKGELKGYVNQQILSVQRELVEKVSHSELNEALSTKANISDVYTKTEMDNALALKADVLSVDSALMTKADKSDTYTKSQVDTKLSAKANSNDVYTKTTMNSWMNLKADKSTVYTRTEINTKLADKADKSDTYTKSEVDTIIENLPEPMIFKGTLGVNGTITDLPVASSANEGFTYKVITDGTYAGQTAKVGDVFTSNGSEWVLIPSGDEENDTWREIKVNGTTVLNSAISSGAVDFVEGDNIEVIFNSTGNKVLIKTKNVYTKTEVDTVLADKADKSNTYTKTEVDTALANKAEIDDSTTSLSKTWSSQKIDGLLILDGTSIGF